MLMNNDTYDHYRSKYTGALNRLQNSITHIVICTEVAYPFYGQTWQAVTDFVRFMNLILLR